MKTLFNSGIKLLFIGCLLGSSALVAQIKEAPKLVVGIVIDQMRYDYIYRYWEKYENKGFKRLVNEGFFCKNTNFNYAPTFTGPGHASIYTGTTPSVHGIIANNWFVSDSNKTIYCTDGKYGQMSPENMLTTTITDELRLSNNMKSKVIGISLKDRGAILPAGHTANAAYWFEGTHGNWISSAYYANKLPLWVNEFNKKEMAKKYLSQPWKTLMPIETYSESLTDDNPYEGLFKEESKSVFPHNLPEIAKISGLNLIRTTPSGNSLTKDFAIETIKSENMGKGKYPDFLTISFSSTDYIGHQYGTNSIEIEDTYLRLDKDLGELIDFLDSSLGSKNVLVFLTADHGATEAPAYLTANKIPSGFFQSDPVIYSLKKFLNAVYGDSLVLDYSNQQIFLNHKVMTQKKINSDEIQNAVADFMLPIKGIANVLTATSLKNTEFKEGTNALIQNGYSEKRSGDVLINLEPSWIEYGKTGTTHGSAYNYDTHVPLLWYGWNIKNGNSAEAVNITDIAPTLAQFLNIQNPSGCTGKMIPYLTK